MKPKVRIIKNSRPPPKAIAISADQSTPKGWHKIDWEDIPWWKKEEDPRVPTPKAVQSTSSPSLCHMVSDIFSRIHFGHVTGYTLATATGFVSGLMAFGYRASLAVDGTFSTAKLVFCLGRIF